MKKFIIVLVLVLFANTVCSSIIYSLKDINDRQGINDDKKIDLSPNPDLRTLRNIKETYPGEKEKVPALRRRKRNIDFSKIPKSPSLPNFKEETFPDLIKAILHADEKKSATNKPTNTSFIDVKDQLNKLEDLLDVINVRNKEKPTEKTYGMSLSGDNGVVWNNLNKRGYSYNVGDKTNSNIQTETEPNTEQTTKPNIDIEENNPDLNITNEIMSSLNEIKSLIQDLINDTDLSGIPNNNTIIKKDVNANEPDENEIIVITNENNTVETTTVSPNLDTEMTDYNISTNYDSSNVNFDDLRRIINNDKIWLWVKNSSEAFMDVMMQKLNVAIKDEVNNQIELYMQRNKGLNSTNDIPKVDIENVENFKENSKSKDEEQSLVNASNIYGYVGKTDKVTNVYILNVDRKKLDDIKRSVNNTDKLFIFGDESNQSDDLNRGDESKNGDKNDQIKPNIDIGLDNSNTTDQKIKDESVKDKLDTINKINDLINKIGEIQNTENITTENPVTENVTVKIDERFSEYKDSEKANNGPSEKLESPSESDNGSNKSDGNEEQKFNGNEKSEINEEPKSEINDNVKLETNEDGNSGVNNDAESNDVAKSEVNDNSKSEADEEAKDDAEPEVKEEAKSEINDDTKSEANEDVKSKVSDVAKSEITDDTKLESNEEAKSEINDDSKSEVNEDAKSEVSDVAKSEITDDLKPEANEEVKSEINEAKTENTEDLRPEITDDTKSEANEATKSESNDDTKSDVNQESKPEANEGLKPEINGELKSEVNGAKSEINDNTKSEINENEQSENKER